MNTKFQKNVKFPRKPKLRMNLKEDQISNEPQILNRHQISKEKQITNEPQILKDHQIAKETQIMNEPQILKEPQIN